MDRKNQIIELLRSTQRDGIENVIETLENNGFFKAPASTRFHLNEEGGLAEHSLNVCNVALRLRDMMIEMDDSLRDRLSRDSVIIASLLHDICKSDIYKPSTRKVKDFLGMWKEVPSYEVDYSDFPLGHGEKSVVMLLLDGLYLSDDEIMAIRWHMSAWDLPFQSPDIKGNYNKAKEKYPLVTLIQAADGLASNMLEYEYEE